MNESKATRYHRWRRRVQSAGAGAAVLALALVALTPAAGWLAGLTEAFTAGWDNPLRPLVTLVLYVLMLARAAALASPSPDFDGRSRLTIRQRPRAG